MHAAAPTPPTGPAQAELSPAGTVNQDSCAHIYRTGEPLTVGNGLHDSGPDLRRELQIEQRGRDIERYRLLSATTPDLGVMWEAMARMNVAKREMYELIAQRSPEQRARMQAAQDLRMAGEPGATR